MISSWASPDVCEVMSNKLVKASMDKNLAKSYVDLPKLMFVAFSFLSMVTN
jgi:hypothetical protein